MVAKVLNPNEPLVIYLHYLVLNFDYLCISFPIKTMFGTPKIFRKKKKY